MSSRNIPTVKEQPQNENAFFLPKAPGGPPSQAQFNDKNKKSSETILAALVKLLEEACADDITLDLFEEPVRLNCSCCKAIEKRKALEIQAKDSKCITCRGTFTSFTPDYLLAQMLHNYREIKKECDSEIRAEPSEGKAYPAASIPVICEAPTAMSEGNNTHQVHFLTPLPSDEEKLIQFVDDVQTYGYSPPPVYSSSARDTYETSATTYEEEDDDVVDNENKCEFSAVYSTPNNKARFFSKNDESLDNIRLPNMAITILDNRITKDINVFLLGCKNDFFLMAIDPSKNIRAIANRDKRESSIHFSYPSWTDRFHIYNFQSIEKLEEFQAVEKIKELETLSEPEKTKKIKEVELNSRYKPDLILVFGYSSEDERFSSHVEQYKTKFFHPIRYFGSSYRPDHTIYQSILGGKEKGGEEKPYFATSYWAQVKAKTFFETFLHPAVAAQKSNLPEKGFVSKLIDRLRR